MDCDQTLSLLDGANDTLIAEAAAALAAHLSACDHCRREVAWRRQRRTLVRGSTMSVDFRKRLHGVVEDHLRRQLRARTFLTPIGWYGLVYTDRGLVVIAGPLASTEEVYARLRDTVGAFIIQEVPRDDVGQRAVEQLIAYHSGQQVTFDVPLDLSRVSPFRQGVLLTTARIPYGEVRSYRWVAREAGHPRATRAVGQALHGNPWAPIIPCHRVIAADNTLGGYAKGLELKQWYLRLEGYLR